MSGTRGQDQGPHRLQRRDRLGAVPPPRSFTTCARFQYYRDLLAQTVPVAVDLGHEPTLTLWDGDEVLCACDRCSARGYGDVVNDVVGGALFEDECPNEAPPKITPLTMTYVPSSHRPSDNLGGRIGA
jgi:hypothetical protein